jgi:hypothetical protein
MSTTRLVCVAMVLVLNGVLACSEAVAQPAMPTDPPHDVVAVNAPSATPPPAVRLTGAIEYAVALGIRKKNANHALVLRDAGQGFANAMAAVSTPRWQAPATKSGLWLEVYTPLSWVSQQAANATREYREFVVTPEMLEPIVRVYAHPDTPDVVTARGAVGTRSVQHVVMQNHRRTVTVQPLDSTDFVVEAKNAVGGSLTYTGQQATFALDDVLRLFAEGEFDIIVVGTSGEKRYTVKRKHFERLPM